MKTREQKQQDAINYLRKTSKHLFIDEIGNFFRVTEEDGKFYLIKNEEKKTEIELEKYFEWYPNDPKQIIKERIFPSYQKHRSVKRKLLKKLTEKDPVKKELFIQSFKERLKAA